MTTEGPTDTSEAVTLESASSAADGPQQRLREFYGSAYDSLGMGV
jgi:hypothetical protein